MEANLNCDLGEKSHHYDGKNDEILMQIINTANIACGFHAGDNETMSQTIKLAKINNISIGAHPSFDDKENFGRKRIYLSETEVTKLVIDQINILNEFAQKADMELFKACASTSTASLALLVMTSVRVGDVTSAASFPFIILWSVAPSGIHGLSLDEYSCCCGDVVVLHIEMMVSSCIYLSLDMMCAQYSSFKYFSNFGST